MFSQPGIRASRTAQQERETPTMSGPSSPGSRMPLAFFDPDTSSLKMSQGTFQWEPPESLERLPDWVMWDGQALYRLPKPERHIVAVGGGVLLPTPRAQNGEERNMKPWIRPLDEPQNLENALARLPGVDTNQRSDGGNESSDDRPPTQSPTDDLTLPL